ncbi:MAG: molybdenum cofactor guanylyltransferase [Gammaproteobacteria bacterium]
MALINGVILAGGQGSRMQYQDKPLLSLAGRPLLTHVITLARPQVENLVISVNSNLTAYQRFGLPLVTDRSTPHRGPLTGLCSAMEWCREQGQHDGFLACFPADVPCFPDDVVTTLLSALRALRGRLPDNPETGETVAWCKTGAQIQPLFSLWPVTCLPRLQEAVRLGIHGPRLYFRTNPNLTVLLPAPQPPLFFNINTPQDLAHAERLLRTG